MIPALTNVSIDTPQQDTTNPLTTASANSCLVSDFYQKVLDKFEMKLAARIVTLKQDWASVKRNVQGSRLKTVGSGHQDPSHANPSQFKQELVNVTTSWLSLHPVARVHFIDPAIKSASSSIPRRLLTTHQHSPLSFFPALVRRDFFPSTMILHSNQENSYSFLFRSLVGLYAVESCQQLSSVFHKPLLRSIGEVVKRTSASGEPIAKRKRIEGGETSASLHDDRNNEDGMVSCHDFLHAIIQCNPSLQHPRGGIKGEGGETLRPELLDAIRCFHELHQILNRAKQQNHEEEEEGGVGFPLSELDTFLHEVHQYWASIPIGVAKGEYFTVLREVFHQLPNTKLSEDRDQDPSPFSLLEADVSKAKHIGSIEAVLASVTETKKYQHLSLQEKRNEARALKLLSMENSTSVQNDEFVYSFVLRNGHYICFGKDWTSDNETSRFDWFPSRRPLIEELFFNNAQVKVMSRHPLLSKDDHR